MSLLHLCCLYVLVLLSTSVAALGPANSQPTRTHYRLLEATVAPTTDATTVPTAIGVVADKPTNATATVTPNSQDGINPLYTTAPATSAPTSTTITSAATDAPTSSAVTSTTTTTAPSPTTAPTSTVSPVTTSAATPPVTGTVSPTTAAAGAVNTFGNSLSTNAAGNLDDALSWLALALSMVLLPCW